MLQFLCRLVVSQQYPLCLALRLKPQAEGRAAHGGSARRGRREESSAGARRRRRALFFGLCRRPADGRLRSGRAQCPSGLGPHLAYAVGRSRRRPDAVAAWPLLVGPRRGQRGEPQVTGMADSQPSVHTLGETARRRRVDESPARSRRAKGQGEGSVRTTKPAPSEYPHATALGKFERRDKTRTFCLRALVRPTRRVGRLGLVIGYREGGARKR